MVKQVDAREFVLDGVECVVKAFARHDGYEIKSFVGGKRLPITYSATHETVINAQWDWRAVVKTLMDLAESDIRNKVPPAV